MQDSRTCVPTRVRQSAEFSYERAPLDSVPMFCGAIRSPVAAAHDVLPKDDAKMADETPVPETLDTIAAKLTALGKSIDNRFTKIDDRFTKIDERFTKIDDRFTKIDERFTNVDQQLAETKAHLGIKIEAVDDKVTRVYDAVIALQQHNTANTKAHAQFTVRLEDHEVRILALEPPKPKRP
jgi:chromosome segregation ATPase